MTKTYRVALIDSISFSKFYVNKNLLGEYFGNMNECTSNEHGDLMIDALLKKINVEEITLDVFNIGDVGNLDMEVIKGHLNVIVSKSYDLVINNLLINMVDAEYYSYFSKIVNSNTLVISPGSEVFLFPNCIRCVWTVFGCSNCSGIEINFKNQAIYIGESVDLFECFSEIRQFENSNWGNCFYNIFFAFKYLNEISSCPLLDKMEILELISREKSGLHMSNNTSFGWINKNLFKDVSEYKFIIYPGLETSDILQNFGYFDNCYSVEGDFPMSGVMTNSDLLIHINPNYHEVKTISFDTTAKELYYGKFSDALDDGRIFYPGTFEDNDIKFTCDATKPSIIISSFFPGCQKLYCQIAFALYCHSAGIIVSNFCHNPLGLMYGFNYRMYFEPKTLVARRVGQAVGCPHRDG